MNRTLLLAKYAERCQETWKAREEFWRKMDFRMLYNSKML